MVHFRLRPRPELSVFFYLSRSGCEPVREWLKEMSVEDRKVIGEDIKLVQFRWPLGMPLVRKIEPKLWEVAVLPECFFLLKRLE